MRTPLPWGRSSIAEYRRRRSGMAVWENLPVVLPTRGSVRVDSGDRISRWSNQGRWIAGEGVPTLLRHDLAAVGAEMQDLCRVVVVGRALIGLATVWLHIFWPREEALIPTSRASANTRSCRSAAPRPPPHQGWCWSVSVWVVALNLTIFRPMKNRYVVSRDRTGRGGVSTGVIVNGDPSAGRARPGRASYLAPAPPSYPRRGCSYPSSAASRSCGAADRLFAPAQLPVESGASDVRCRSGGRPCQVSAT